ncbi:hypothetical protein BJ508DRAFT_379614 [Ascobolus immersus RN42]|uniref:F-box domain-containing protein n=1 Tax=Ascobolus immersus RN42 TaxID=1160509 RepID=A0A3N4HVY0_ASCIM|nr:hypothetical protein BJ508DRAFT_379614 [Ascobolus immersus RN42]
MPVTFRDLPPEIVIEIFTNLPSVYDATNFRNLDHSTRILISNQIYHQYFLSISDYELLEFFAGTPFNRSVSALLLKQGGTGKTGWIPKAGRNLGSDIAVLGQMVDLVTRGERLDIEVNNFEIRRARDLVSTLLSENFHCLGLTAKQANSTYITDKGNRLQTCARKVISYLHVLYIELFAPLEDPNASAFERSEIFYMAVAAFSSDILDASEYLIAGGCCGTVPHIIMPEWKYFQRVMASNVEFMPWLEHLYHRYPVRAFCLALVLVAAVCVAGLDVHADGTTNEAESNH